MKYADIEQAYQHHQRIGDYSTALADLAKCEASVRLSAADERVIIHVPKQSLQDMLRGEIAKHFGMLARLGVEDADVTNPEYPPNG